MAEQVKQTGGGGTATPTEKTYMTNKQFKTLQATVRNDNTTLRREVIDRLINPQRSIDTECQYPITISIEDYQVMFDRLGLATRLIEIWPEECWKLPPKVFETEDSTETEFEKIMDELLRRIPLWHSLYRADVLSGIGQYGVLLLGINDGLELSEPVMGVDEKGEKVGKAKSELLYVRPFSQSIAEVYEKEKDMTNPRYGFPVSYKIKFEGEEDTASKEVVVHWTRCIHLADNRTDSDIYGVPRLTRVYNNLLDVKKISGGSGEMFWRGGFPGYSIELSPEAEKAGSSVDIDMDSVKEQVYLWGQGLQRMMYLTGLTAKSLAPQVSDPSGHLDWHVKLIGMSYGVPYRILLGSEEAKLASTQDKRTWNERVQKRQENYCTPMILRNLMDRLIAVGVLPEPKEYFVEWADLDSLTEADQADVALKMTEAFTKYVAGNVDIFIPPREYLTVVHKFTEDQAQAIEDARVDEESHLDRPEEKRGRRQ